jgi:hypothetical protein
MVNFMKSLSYVFIFGTFCHLWAANGGYSGAFLRIGLGARGIGMGNAQVAMPCDGFGFYYNAAGLPYLENKSANFSYNFLSLDRRFNFIGFSTPLKPAAGLSIGWIYSGVGNITGYNSIGQETGTIEQGLHAIYLSFGIFVIPNTLSIGISGKFLIERISDQEDSFNYKGNGFGADIGVLFRATSWLFIGYQLKDVNAKLKSNTDDIYERGMDLDNAFPITNRIGLSFRTPLQWARLAYDFEWSDSGDEKHHIGLEFLNPLAAARVGFDANHLTFGGGLNFTTGLGINGSLNYAFVNSVIDEGVSHIFTWELRF